MAGAGAAGAATVGISYQPRTRAPGASPPVLAFPTPRRVLATVVAVTTGTALPVFLLGALEVQVRRSLGINLAAFGAALSLYYLVASTGSVPGGWITERLGGDRTLRLAGFLSAAALAVIAAGVYDWGALVAALVVAGAASTLAQPAANLMIAELFPQQRQGAAFGVKQSAIPLAALLGGSSVPAIALSIGWRWAYVAAAALTLVSTVFVPRVKAPPALTRMASLSDGGGRDARGPLIVLAAAMFFGLVAATALSGFLVSSAVAAGGLGRATAGWVAAIAGAVALSVRLIVGWQSDRRWRRHLLLIASMLALGTAGYAGIAAGSATHNALIFALGAAVAFGAGWGWNGLFNFAVVRAYPRAPAWATGISQTGGRLGSMVGPVVFAFSVSQASYAWAWISAALCAGGGAVLMLVARWMLRRHQPGLE